MTGSRHVVSFAQQSCEKTTKHPTQRERYLYPRFPRGSKNTSRRMWNRACMGDALLLTLYTFFCYNSFFTVENVFLFLYTRLIRVDNSLWGHCLAISSCLKWDAFFRLTNKFTLPDLPSGKWLHPFVRHVQTNNLLNRLFTLGNDFFYSYGSYSESTAVLQGPLSLTVSFHRILSSEIHFADNRSKPGIYGGCFGHVHLYNSFTVICDLLALNST